MHVLFLMATDFMDFLDNHLKLGYDGDGLHII